MSHYHHWRIAEANGPMSDGTCACGAVKRFPNSEAAAFEMAGRGFSFGNMTPSPGGNTKGAPVSSRSAERTMAR